MLQLEQVQGGYGNQMMIQGIDLALNSGEWLSLLGANGSGKSTLLKLISRILPMQSGIICLDGQLIHHQPAKQVAQQLALLPQQQTIPAGLTVYQLVCLGRTPYQSWWQWDLTPADRDKVNLSLVQTGMYDFRDRLVTQLSGGERQRAFLALALTQDPRVLLLDEPTTYLDLRHQLELLELLKILNQNHGLTIVTVLHDLNLAARYSDRLALLYQGRLAALGSPPQVLTQENLAQVFGITASLIDTPVGLQICALSADSSLPNLNYV